MEISASPEAAEEAVTWQVPNQAFQAEFLMSDGVTVLNDLYEPGGRADCFDAAVDDPCWVIDRTIQLESDDAACQRWPRSKIHDDKAVASGGLMDFT